MKIIAISLLLAVTLAASCDTRCLSFCTGESDYDDCMVMCLKTLCAEPAATSDLDQEV